MKVRVQYETEGISVNETFDGSTCDDVVRAMKKRVASEAGFAARIVINSMSTLGFAQEVVRRYNRQHNRSVKHPESCEEFLEAGEAEGILMTVDG